MSVNLPAPDADQASWTAWCLARLEFHDSAAAHDPMNNSVRRLAYEIFEGHQSGAISDETVALIAKGLGDQALIERADEFAQTHSMGVVDREAVNKLLSPLEGLTFDKVRRALERTRAGIVFTAHPTFAISATLRRAVADYASDPSDRVRAAGVIAQTPHAPDENITLGDEHGATQAAILRAKIALRDVTRGILGWARQKFPAQWTALSPAPISVASWVGYDLDGRTDIHWGETFRLRLEEKAQQLDAYAEQLRLIDAPSCQKLRDELAAILAGAAALAAEQAVLFSGDLDDPEKVVAAANKLTGNDPRKLTSLEGVLRKIAALIDAADGDDSRLDLCTLRSEMLSYGLGAAHIHLRINAAQLRSALRADLGVDEGRGFLDRTTLSTAATKAGTVSTRRINIASIFLEQMTARRQLMLCAEFVKHIDADTPIRFLIAECEAPATVMGAIYLARLYGVDHRLDISPLFETPEAMERGGRFMERLLDEEEFVAYIRARGRVAIQIGFSDSGRFMGQVAANLAIERLQIVFARALAAHDIRDVEVVIFNTHGESMGRGGFPGSLDERFDYLITPWTRARYAHENLPLNIESSFQGGDGFLHFETAHLASATVASLLRWSFSNPKPDRSDRYYSDINYSWDFYRSIKAWQEMLFDDSDYQIAIGAFAPHLLFTTGSRKVRRQSGAAITGPRSLRAIPHNAILQQLAAPANVFGGAGSASGAEADRLLAHIRGSGRMRQIIKMIRQSRRLTSLPAMRAYAVLLNASFWISKAAGETDRAAAAACEEIALHLKETTTAAAINRLADHFAADLAKLDRVFLELDGADYNADRRSDRRAMHVLHALRQALIMRGIILTATLPSFSRRHDVSRASLFEMAFGLRFGELAALLEEIFPADAAGAAMLSAIEEESDGLDDHVHGYPEIHREVIGPLRDIHQRIREIGVGLSHYYRAYG